MNRCLRFAVLALAAFSALGSGFPPERQFRAVEVAPGVLAFISAPTSGPIPSGNVVAVIGDEAVLVVDSGRFPTLARRMVAEIKKRTDRPVRYLVHTHWHLDHIVGDAAFREAYPGIVFVSTGHTRRKIADKQIPYVRDIAKIDSEYAGGLRQYVEGGKRRDGTPIPANVQKYLRQQIADIALETAEVSGATVVVPNLVFEKELVVHLGKRPVRIAFLGKGNTAGDAVVIVPDARVVITGDLLVAPTPYGYGCHPAEWIETLKTLSALDAAAIVPGHGDVMRDWSYAAKVSALLSALRTLVAEAVAAGATLEQTQERVDLAALRGGFAGDDWELQQAFDDFFVRSAVDRAYQEATGRMAEE
jgi:glyoxylase-like metal-dependent hydrolase (beta-lactamase superfamily II)